VTPVRETTAARLVRSLREQGVDTVFGLPGGEIVEVLDELRSQGLRFVLARHEASATFMADAVARLNGRPAVCLTTLGPGAANALAGVAHAYLDRSPLLLITAQKPGRLLPDYTHQVLDLHALYAPITKASICVTPQNVDGVVGRATAIALSDRPGPVHLQLSTEEATTIANADPTPPELTHQRQRLPMAGHPDVLPRKLLDEATRLLRRSTRPLILVGLGIEPEGPYVELGRLARSLDAPVVVTPKAKGAIADDQPLAAGVIGLTPTDPVYELLNEADCVVAIGFDVVELVKPWQVDAPLIWISGWENRSPALPAAVEFVGPVGPPLEKLATESWNPTGNWGQTRVRTFRQERAVQLPPPCPGCLLPQAVLRVLRQNVPTDAIMAVDVGSHKILASLDWPATWPNRFLVSNGLSCMGYGLASAIGASYARPDTPILCLTGDAGLAMALGELGGLATRRCPVAIVVMNDGALDLIRSHQRRAGKPAFGTEFANPDFVAIARAYGMEGRRVTSEDELAAAVRVSMDERHPVLIDVTTDPTSYPTSRL
jgi:acetolactate synthase-1/2/3 large subunit